MLLIWFFQTTKNDDLETLMVQSANNELANDGLSTLKYKVVQQVTLINLIVSSLCQVGNTSSHLNTEVKQHYAWIVLGSVTPWELLVLLAETEARLHCRSILAKQMGGKFLSRLTGWTVFRLACWWSLKSGPQRTSHLNWPNRVLPWKWPNPIKKEQLQS